MNNPNANLSTILRDLGDAEKQIQKAMKAVKAQIAINSGLKRSDTPYIKPCWKRAYEQDQRIRRTHPDGAKLTHPQVYEIACSQGRNTAATAKAHEQYVQAYRRAMK